MLVLLAVAGVLVVVVVGVGVGVGVGVLVGVVVLGWAIGDTNIMSIGVSRRGIRIWEVRLGMGVILRVEVVMVDGDGGGRGTRKEGGGRRGGDGFAWRGRRGGRGWLEVAGRGGDRRAVSRVGRTEVVLGGGS